MSLTPEEKEAERKSLLIVEAKLAEMSLSDLNATWELLKSHVELMRNRKPIEQYPNSVRLRIFHLRYRIEAEIKRRIDNLFVE